VCLSACVWADHSQPIVLVVQPKTPTTPGDEMDLSMANYIASQFYTEGRAKAIVYGLTDPMFRDAVDSGKLVKPPKWPTLTQSFAIAQRLGADYVFAFHPGSIKDNAEKARAELYDHGRKVWSEEVNLGVRQNDSVSKDSTSESIARTWVMHLQTDKGPFKAVSPVHAQPTPTDQTGQQPVAPTTPPPTKVDDDSNLKTLVEKLLLDHMTDRAIALLRDAVDQKPYDAERRIMLVQTLLDAHESAAAGEEADRAVLIAPDHTELRALAAKAWLAAGKSSEAQAALTDAIVHNKDDVKTRLTLAEISIARLEPDKALDLLDSSIKQKPTRQAYYLRALCRALLGGSDGLQNDLSAAGKLNETETQSDVRRRYELAASTLDDAFKAMGDETRILLQRATVRPDDAGIHEQVNEYLRVLKSRIAYLNAIPVPAAYHGSNERRLLAHRDMVQTMLSLQSFFSGGGQDAMTDARIDLGEALKQAASAKSAFETEKSQQ
jgi:tetratricopeptide (TPR) repeat protein